MADKNTIARPYAEATFELARESQRLDAWSDALRLAGDLLEDGRVAKFLAHPKLSDEQRLSFLTGLFRSAGGDQSIFAGDDRQGRNFLRIVLEYERVAALPEMSEHFDELKSQAEKTVDVTVTSATELGDAQCEALVAALKKRLGCEVRLDTELDENLIGGAVIRAGDVVIDGSLRSRLQGLSNALIV